MAREPEPHKCPPPPWRVLAAAVAIALLWISIFPLMGWLCRTVSALIKGIV